ncbi:mCG131507 [Mus musculus]|nr:mCG131507 [Mus musculus]
MNTINPTMCVLVNFQSQEIQDFLLLPLPDLVRDRKANCSLKSTKQFVASETGTKDLMGDSFKLSCERVLCISLLQLASSTSGEGILKVLTSEYLGFFSTPVVLCSDCSKRLRSRP